MTTSLPGEWKMGGLTGRKMGGLTCVAKDIVEHDIAEASEGFVGRLWEEDAFSCGETAGFEDDGVGTGEDVGCGVVEVVGGECGVGSGRDVVAGHEVFCKGL